MKIIWSTESRTALRAIERYIGRDSKFYAKQMIARIVDRVERAVQAPGQGYPVHEYPEAPLKEVHEDPYRIIYQATAHELKVVTIVHFKQCLSMKEPHPR